MYYKEIHITLYVFIDCPEMNHVFIYDSLPSGNISSRTKEHIASICFCEKEDIQVTICDVQKQRGGDDCGLFALAFATTLCAGDNPSETNYIQQQLREHLISSLENNTITPFPKRPRKRRPGASLEHNIQVYCHCRQPHSGSKMVQCSNCNEWFHQDCEDVPSKVWREKSYIWKCKNC